MAVDVPDYSTPSGAFWWLFWGIVGLAALVALYLLAAAAGIVPGPAEFTIDDTAGVAYAAVVLVASASRRFGPRGF